MEIEPIAHIRTDFKGKFGIPRQSCLAEGCVGKIVFEPKYRVREALRGIEGYSHLWLIFDFSESHADWSPTVRPPRLGGNKRMGVFATRSPFRPNSLGLSSVRLLSVDDTDEGPVLTVEGADILDGTPIYDVKPYLKFTDCHEDAVSGFADEVCGQKLEVTYSDDVASALPEDALRELISCLEQDPRPHYQDGGRTYRMSFRDWEISFSVSGNVLTIISADCVRRENP